MTSLGYRLVDTAKSGRRSCVPFHRERTYVFNSTSVFVSMHDSVFLAGLLQDWQAWAIKMVHIELVPKAKTTKNRGTPHGLSPPPPSPSLHVRIIEAFKSESAGPNTGWRCSLSPWSKLWTRTRSEKPASWACKKGTGKKLKDSKELQVNRHRFATTKEDLSTVFHAVPQS